MIIESKYELSGVYELAVYRDGKLVRKLPPFTNHITNIGLDQYGITATSTIGFLTYCFAGSGNTPPTNSDTTMQSYLGETNTQTSSQSENVFVAPRYMVQRRVFSFAVGAVVGNVSELGIGWKPNASTRSVFSRALVVDGTGTPTTITVLATEQLIVTYRLYVKIPDADSSFDYTDNGVTYTITIRPNFTTANPGFNYFPNGPWGDAAGGSDFAYAKETDVLPNIETDYSFTGGANSAGGTPIAYVNGSYELRINYLFSGSIANYGTGIGQILAFTRNGSGKWVYKFSPKIGKVAGQSLTFTHIVKWARGVAP